MFQNSEKEGWNFLENLDLRQHDCTWKWRPAARRGWWWAARLPAPSTWDETTWTGFSNLDPPGRLSDQLSRELNKMPIQVFSQSGTLEERSCTGFSIPPEWISKSLHIWLAWWESLKTFETHSSNKLWIESFAFIQESLQKVISPDLINKYDKHVLWNFSKILSLKIINSLRQGHQWWEQ